DFHVTGVQTCALPISLFLPTSKGDRDNQGRTFRAPALRALCPVEAVNTWLTLTGRTEGPLFPRIDRWGRLSETPMNPGSINKWQIGRASCRERVWNAG